MDLREHDLRRVFADSDLYEQEFFIWNQSLEPIAVLSEGKLVCLRDDLLREFVYYWHCCLHEEPLSLYLFEFD